MNIDFSMIRFSISQLLHGERETKRDKEETKERQRRDKGETKERQRSERFSHPPLFDALQFDQ